LAHFQIVKNEGFRIWQPYPPCRFYFGCKNYWLNGRVQILQLEKILKCTKTSWLAALNNCFKKLAMAIELPLYPNVSHKKSRWLVAAGLMAVAIVVSMGIPSSILAKRYEPRIGDQAIRYLRDRFDSEAELGTLHIHMPKVPTRWPTLTGGLGSVAEVDCEDLLLRHRGCHDWHRECTLSGGG